MGDTRLWAMAVIVIVTFVITVAQLLYKHGMNMFPEIQGIIIVIGGISLYAVGSILMILAFRGGELSILYPLLAFSYIWVSIASPIFFPDVMNPVKWAGIVFIMLGISAVGVGSR